MSDSYLHPKWPKINIHLTTYMEDFLTQALSVVLILAKKVTST